MLVGGPNNQAEAYQDSDRLWGVNEPAYWTATLAHVLAHDASGQ